MLTLSPFGPAGPGIPDGPIRPFCAEKVNTVITIYKLTKMG